MICLEAFSDRRSSVSLECYAGDGCPRSSFAERINSAANIVLTKVNSLLDPVTVNMLVVLHMNRSFMENMRKRYKNISRQDFNMSVVTVETNKDG